MLCDIRNQSINGSSEIDSASNSYCSKLISHSHSLSNHGNSSNGNLSGDISDTEIELRSTDTFSPFDILQDVKKSDDNKQTLRDKLGKWSIQFNVSHVAVSSLLKILNDQGIEDLPYCSKTLLQTPRHLKMTAIPGGKYFFFGISNTVRLLLESNVIQENVFPIFKNISSKFISLTISTDGIPICKSSNVSMWPILLRVDQIPKSVPIMCALYSGETKPLSVQTFLKPVVAELNSLMSKGICVNGIVYDVKISSVIADAPARSFIKCIKGHNAYHGCERCEVEGDYFLNRMIFSSKSGCPRTDQSFRSKSDIDHHQANAVSPLIDLNIDMVSYFVLDYMHLVCLGVMRKLLHLWVSGPLKVRLPSNLVKKLSSYLMDCSKHVPVEFARKPRSLRDVHRYKATEFRQFLLYTGPCLLLDVLKADVLSNFMYLHCAMKILLSECACIPEYNSIARYLLEKFVESGTLLYGNEFLVFNVHNLLHLADDGLNYGNLDRVSAFPFENYMQKLKRLVRGQHLQLEQVVRRVHEENNFLSPTTVCQKECFVRNNKIQFETFVLNNKLGNNCFTDKYDRLLCFKSVNVENHNITCFELKSQNAGWYPIPSKVVRAFKVEATQNKVIVHASDVIDKCILMPFANRKNRFLCQRLNLNNVL